MKRQNDTDRIARENQSLLRRLQTVRPQYNSKEWEVDYRQHQSRSKNMQLFPHIEVSGLFTLAGSRGEGLIVHTVAIVLFVCSLLKRDNSFSSGD